MAATPRWPPPVNSNDHLSPAAGRERRAQLDRLAVGGALQPPRRRPAKTGEALAWLATLLWPAAALCAAGLMIGAAG